MEYGLKKTPTREKNKASIKKKKEVATKWARWDPVRSLWEFQILQREDQEVPWQLDS